MDKEEATIFGTWSVPAQCTSLSTLSEFVTEAAQAVGLDERATYQVQMVVEEACDNIIEHAYADTEDGNIECTCFINKDELKIVLRDYGQPFDPTSIPQPDRTASLDKRKTGGLGLYFIFRLMDDVKFEFTDDAGNVLTLIKRKDPSP